MCLELKKEVELLVRRELSKVRIVDHHVLDVIPIQDVFIPQETRVAIAGKRLERVHQVDFLRSPPPLLQRSCAVSAYGFECARRHHQAREILEVEVRDDLLPNVVGPVDENSIQTSMDNIVVC